MLNILTWNINGIRSSKQELKVLLDSLDADIICLQETKITRDMLDEKTALVEGYTSYYSFCRKRAGYSGVATYCKNECMPLKAEEGLTGIINSNEDSIQCYNHIHTSFTDDELKDIDSEGRCIMTLHKVKEGETEISLVVVNVYCPNSGDNDERLEYKLQFFKALQLRCQDFLDHGYRVIVLGDLNVSHRLIDHCEPEDLENFSKTPSRLWMESFLGGENGNFVDSFRKLYPNQEKAFTCWNTKINARANNYGTRIDYVLLSSKLVPDLRECLIMKEVYGSDHCPVKASIDIDIEPSSKPPSICTQYFKEFSGKQLKILAYVSKRSLTHETEETSNSQQPKKIRLATENKNTVKQQQSSLLNFFNQKSNRLQKSFAQVQKEETENSSSALLSCSFIDSSLSTNIPAETLDSQRESSQPVTSQTISDSASSWKSLLRGPPPPPLCSGHKEPCVLRTVKKKGPNMNRQFWACARAAGHSSDKNAQCNFFMWSSTKR